jgi:hypothetical protein
MSGIVLDTNVASLYYKRRLPAEVRRYMAGHQVHVAFATAGELRQWAVARKWDWAARTGMQLWLLPPRPADPSSVMEVRSPVPSYAALRSIERTGGRWVATRSQLAPASGDR